MAKIKEDILGYIDKYKIVGLFTSMILDDFNEFRTSIY